jgi:exodeoxyribonuclease VII small subunit
MSDDTIGDPKQFEASLQALEAIVDQLEQGDLTLEASLEAFERGVRLSRGCQQALDQAEQRIRILTEPSTDADPQDFSGFRESANSTVALKPSMASAPDAGLNLETDSDADAGPPPSQGNEPGRD